VAANALPAGAAVTIGQTGVAPNAIELHPVLKFSAAAC
jgi:hypothetical protein